MALRFIASFPWHDQIQRPMLALAHEEMRHFRQVLDRLEARGLKLAPPRADRYVRALRARTCQMAGGLGGAADLLLVSAFVEARSCERFRALALGLPGEDLGDFYRGLAVAEARHWETFRDLAATLAAEDRVQRRLAEVAEMEAEILAGLPPEPRMH